MNDSLHRAMMFWKPGTAWCSAFTASYHTHMHSMSHPALEQACTHYYKTASKVRERGKERLLGTNRLQTDTVTEISSFN